MITVKMNREKIQKLMIVNYQKQIINNKKNQMKIHQKLMKNMHGIQAEKQAHLLVKVNLILIQVLGKKIQNSTNMISKYKILIIKIIKIKISIKILNKVQRMMNLKINQSVDNHNKIIL